MRNKYTLLWKTDVCDICQRKFEDERVFETHKKLHSRLQTVYQRK